jgi:plastocyanin
VLLLLALASAGLATGVFAARNHAGAVTRVTVTATEFRFTLSRRTIPVGAVVFTVVNKGKLAHDFKLAGKKTHVLAPGKSTTLRVTLKKGRFVYLCTLPGHAAAGMTGVLVVGTAPILTTPGPQLAATTTITGPATTVDVDMYEYRFALSQASVPAGKVTFVVTNKGVEVHNFDIPGVKDGAFLQPGATETWTVALAPQSYPYRCNVPFHADRGMAGTLAVT